MTLLFLQALAVVLGCAPLCRLGRAIAEELGRGGAKAVVNYSRSKELVEQLSQNGSEAVAIQADVSDAEQAERLMNETLERFRQVTHC